MVFETLVDNPKFSTPQIADSGVSSTQKVPGTILGPTQMWEAKSACTSKEQFYCSIWHIKRLVYKKWGSIRCQAQITWGPWHHAPRRNATDWRTISSICLIYYRETEEQNNSIALCIAWTCWRAIKMTTTTTTKTPQWCRIWSCARGASKYTDIQRDAHIDSQTHRHTDRHRHRQTHTNTDTRTDKQTNKHTHIHTNSSRHLGNRISVLVLIQTVLVLVWQRRCVTDRQTDRTDRPKRTTK